MGGGEGAVIAGGRVCGVEVCWILIRCDRYFSEELQNHADPLMQTGVHQ